MTDKFKPALEAVSSLVCEFGLLDVKLVPSSYRRLFDAVSVAQDQLKFADHLYELKTIPDPRQQSFTEDVIITQPTVDWCETCDNNKSSCTC